MTSSTKIAFLGIGLMGEPMARRLCLAGFPMTVWNRSAGKTAALAALGATVATSVQDAVRNAEIVISMLEAGPAVAQMIDQAQATIVPGALWIDMSSTQQGEAQTFHATLSARGRRFMDAPVSGGVAGAQAGSLAIMAGGSGADFLDAEAVFAALGRATLVGPAGSGQVAKLCNQLIVGATLNIVAEALLLAQAAGADPAAVRTAIRGGFAESKILEMHGQRMLERNFIPGGQAKTQRKDMDNVLLAAGAAGLSLPIAALVTAHYQALEEHHPAADHSAVLLTLEQANPGLRLGHEPDQLP
jgi:2-hydroxy-3-oxopropionate reductase